MTTSLQIIRPTGPRIRGTKTPEVGSQAELLTRPVTARASEVRSALLAADATNNGTDAEFAD